MDGLYRVIDSTDEYSVGRVFLVKGCANPRAAVDKFIQQYYLDRMEDNELIALEKGDWNEELLQMKYTATYAGAANQNYRPQVYEHTVTAMPVVFLEDTDIVNLDLVTTS